MSVLFLMISFGFAQEYIGVLDVVGDVSNSIKTQLADETRSGALLAVPRSQYAIMTRENILSILHDQNKSDTCFDGSCEVEIGRNIGADFIISGQVLQIEGVYLYSLKIHNTKNGVLLATKRIEGDSGLELIRKTAEITEAFVAKALDIPSSAEGHIPVQNTYTTQFHSNPNGAEVWIDNTRICSATPCSAEIASGFHNVEVKKHHYQTWNTTFYAKQGFEINPHLIENDVKLHLESTSSDIKVYLDDQYLGTTPLPPQSITPGAHLLRYEGLCVGIQEEHFIAKDGVNIFREISTDAFTSPLHVSAINQHGKPIRGRVYLDGQFAGYTPFLEQISSCANRVEVEAEIDEIVQRRSISLSLQQNKEEHITLEFFSTKPP